MGWGCVTPATTTSGGLGSRAHRTSGNRPAPGSAATARGRRRPSGVSAPRAAASAIATGGRGRPWIGSARHGGAPYAPVGCGGAMCGRPRRATASVARTTSKRGDAGSMAASTRTSGGRRHRWARHAPVNVVRGSCRCMVSASAAIAMPGSSAVAGCPTGCPRATLPVGAVASRHGSSSTTELASTALPGACAPGATRSSGAGGANINGGKSLDR